MQIREIIVGQKYMVDYSCRCKVLEAGVDRVNRNGNTRKDGLRVIFQSGCREDQESIIASHQIKQLWSEYQAERRARQLSHKISKMDRQRVSLRADLLKESLQKHGIEVLSVYVSLPYQDDDHSADLGLSEQSVGQLINLLDSPEIAERALAGGSHDTGGALAELLS